MPFTHTVELGDTIASIAFRYGFFPDVIWDDPANAALRAKRTHPNVLEPGDAVTIPDKRQKTERIETGKRSRFVRRGVPEYLILKLENAEGEPRGGTPYELYVDGKVRTGTTDGGGVLKEAVPPDAYEALVIIGPDERYVFQLGHLGPADTVRGAQARLRNLGYRVGHVDGELGPMTLSGLAAFRDDHGLPEPAEPGLDAAVSKLLEDLHGA